MTAELNSLKCPVQTSSKRALLAMWDEEARDGCHQLTLKQKSHIFCMRVHDAWHELRKPLSIAPYIRWHLLLGEKVTFLDRCSWWASALQKRATGFCYIMLSGYRDFMNPPTL